MSLLFLMLDYRYFFWNICKTIQIKWIVDRKWETIMNSGIISNFVFFYFLFFVLFCFVLLLLERELFIYKEKCVNEKLQCNYALFWQFLKICLSFRLICDGCGAFIIETCFDCIMCSEFHLCFGCYQSGKYPKWCVLFVLSILHC